MRLLVPSIEVQTPGEIPFVGGHVALDFVNTAEERGHAAAEDVLLTPADLRTWGRRTGLLSAVATSRDEAGELESAIDARELLYTLLAARVNGTKPQKGKLAQLAGLAAEAYSAATLESGRDGQLEWRWDKSDLASVRHVAVTSAAELLRSSPAGRLKQCPGDRCGWLFLDTSKRGNRRWCSMSECGQDAKDEQRRLRRQAGSRS
jgi:predicted RNA-binding Zn ribbon-like protein